MICTGFCVRKKETFQKNYLFLEANIPDHLSVKPSAEAGYDHINSLHNIHLRRPMKMNGTMINFFFVMSRGMILALKLKYTNQLALHYCIAFIL